jgi:ArsR family transcriptional regulator
MLAEASRWELYRVLSEPVRLRLLALAAEEELTIGELADLVGESQPNV